MFILRHFGVHLIVSNGSTRTACILSPFAWISFGCIVLTDDIIEKKGGYRQMSTIPIYQPRATNVQNYGLARENSSTAVQNKPKIELNKGDMVLHTAFGKGMVLSVLKMGAYNHLR